MADVFRGQDFAMTEHPPQRNRDRGRSARWLARHLTEVHGWAEAGAHWMSFMGPFHDGLHGFIGILDPSNRKMSRATSGGHPHDHASFPGDHR